MMGVKGTTWLIPVATSVLSFVVFGGLIRGKGENKSEQHYTISQDGWAIADTASLVVLPPLPTGHRAFWSKK